MSTQLYFSVEEASLPAVTADGFTANTFILSFRLILTHSPFGPVFLKQLWFELHFNRRRTSLRPKCLRDVLLPWKYNHEMHISSHLGIGAVALFVIQNSEGPKVKGAGGQEMTEGRLMIQNWPEFLLYLGVKREKLNAGIG